MTDTLTSQQEWNAARLAWATAHDCRIDGAGNLYRRLYQNIDHNHQTTITFLPERFALDPTNLFLVPAGTPYQPGGQPLEEGQVVEMELALTYPVWPWPVNLAAWSAGWDAAGWGQGSPQSAAWAT